MRKVVPARDHAAHIAWFLAGGCDTLIDTFAELNIGLHVP